MGENTVEDEQLLYELQSRIVSHVREEISIPLGAAIVGVQLLQEYWDKLDPERRADRFDRILASLQKITQVVQGLPDQDFIHLDDFFVEYDILTLCLDIVRTYNEYEEYRGRVRLTTGFSEIMMHMNVDSLRYMVCKLVGFILNYSPTESMVDMELSADDERVTLQFIDQGALHRDSDLSMPMNLSLCGDPKLQRTTDRSRSLVQDCIRLHGGSISFDKITQLGFVTRVVIPRYHRQVPE